MRTRRSEPSSPAAAPYVRAKIAPGNTPWRDARYCVVDLELSGLDPRRDEILSFASVSIDDGRVIAGDALYGLCRPTRQPSEESVLIHGLRMADLLDAPTVDEAIEPLLVAMTGRIMVAHVARIEESFLAPVLKRLGVRLRSPILDTYELGRLLAAERRQPAPPFDLDELARSLSLPIHRPHHALGDALTTAQVFIALATHLDEFAGETVRSLANAKRRLRQFAG